MQIIDGKKVSAQVKQEVKNETELLKKEYSITPGLAVVIVGDDPASRVYVNNKKKACELVGFHSEEYALPAETTQEELLSLVKELNEKKDINGILVQLPLPKHLDDKAVIEAINPLKDVDAFHAVNVGKIMLGEYDFLPCTPAGVMEMLHYYNIEVSGKNCVVIGRSNIVGKPMGMLLLHENGTVTICHSRTKNLAEVCSSADILVAAARCGVDRVFLLGGAQAVAALADGTESVPKVDKIVGPGNIFVATAKKLVYGDVDIEFPAGPSEMLALVDETANPEYIATELLAQIGRAHV